MNVDLSKSSVVRWYEETEKHRCGYCKNESSISNGMWAESISVDDYQDLVDRGWRRSGKYCYKPIMDKTCCPLYTIKCDCINFSLSKSQKRVIKKFNKFLKDGELNARGNSSDSHNIEEPESCTIIPREIPKINLSNVSTNISDCMGIKIAPLEASTSKMCEKFGEKKDKIDENLEQTCDSKPNESSQIKSNLKTALKEGLGADPNKPPCKKAKLLRIERKKEKALKTGKGFEKTQTTLFPKTLEEFLEESISEYNKFQFRIRLIPTSTPNSNWKEVEGIEFDMYKRYQMIIHNDPPSKLTLHGFNRFLVKSPLKPKSFPKGVEGSGYGSFHQQYWFNDKLVAVGVIDILPRCISSVYFFYDPDYRNLTLGTYGSLRELQLTRQLQKSLPDLKSYYMGFYIHSCPKMRYKGKLVPSYLVCPETYSWISIEKCIPLLDANKYSRLNDDVDALDDNLPSEEDILETKIVYKSRLMRFRNYKNFVDKLEKYREIGNLVGKTCMNNLIFWEH